MPVTDLVPAAISAVSEGVKAWREYKSEDAQKGKDRNKAIDSVMSAALATKAYLYDLEISGIKSREKEHELSQSWQKASSAIRKYDEALFHSSQVKALGWADPREWDKANDKAVTVNLDLLIEQCNYLKDNEI